MTEISQLECGSIGLEGCAASLADSLPPRKFVVCDSCQNTNRKYKPKKEKGEQNTNNKEEEERCKDIILLFA